MRVLFRQTTSLTHHHRRELELCALPINDDCTPDEEFSAYYGRDVFVC